MLLNFCILIAVGVVIFLPKWRAVRRDRMTKMAFYRDRRVVRCDWWVGESRLPEVHWARLRVLDNGSADVTWEDDEVTYGFESTESASNFLLEDEARAVVNLDEADLDEARVDRKTLIPPDWSSWVPESSRFLGN
jgi:hypothetical protein